MPCLDPNEIVAFFSPYRTFALSARVDAHAAGCESCRRLLAEYANLGGATAMTAAAAPSLTPASGTNADESRASLMRQLLASPGRQRVGVTLKGKWKIERLLGSGGMAHVYEARHRNGRRVAVKFMRPELTTDVGLVERFLREGYVANKIEHPGAVAILDDEIDDDGTPFLVMELLIGETLRERLARGPLPLGEALAIIGQLLEILTVAHAKGVVHRDIKPDNVFLTATGELKVLDFGIARLKDHSARASAAETQSGTTMGTVGFMSPEQARGLTAEIDARSDVWAVGATLYTLLTGQSLHQAETQNVSLLLAMTTPVPPMAQLLPLLPPPVAALLDRALAYHAEARWPDARSMLGALTHARGTASHTVVMVRGSAPSTIPPAMSGVAPSKATETMLARALSRGSMPGAETTSSRTLKASVIAGGALAGIALALVFVWPSTGSVAKPGRDPEASRAPSSLKGGPAASTVPAAPFDPNLPPAPAVATNAPWPGTLSSPEPLVPAAPRSPAVAASPAAPASPVASATPATRASAPPSASTSAPLNAARPPTTGLPAPPHGTAAPPTAGSPPRKAVGTGPAAPGSARDPLGPRE